MAGSRRTTTAAAWVHILSTLVCLLLSTILTQARSPGGRCGWWTNAYIGEGGLISAVRGRLRGGVHWHSKMLLRHLLGELEAICVRRYIGHLALHLEIGTGKVLLGLNHPHVNVLLMSGSDLLLLLLENFDLLCNRKLLHLKNL